MRAIQKAMMLQKHLKSLKSVVGENFDLYPRVLMGALLIGHNVNQLHQDMDAYLC